MANTERAPWNPDPRQVDPLIAILALLCLLLAGMLLAGRAAAPRRATPRAGVQARLAELWPALPAAPPKASAWTWDDGARAILEAERGARPSGPGPSQADPLFTKAWKAAYEGRAETLDLAETGRLREALGDGFAARMLEARLLALRGGDPGPLREEARRWRQSRSVLLALVAGTGTIMLLVAAVLAALWVIPPRKGMPARPQAPGPSLRAALVVFLAWFLAFLLSGTLAGAATQQWPALKPYTLPLAYAFHACTGFLLVSLATGRSLARQLGDLIAGYDLRQAAQGLGYLCLAAGLVSAVSLLLSPLMPSGDLPQRELVVLLTHIASPWALAASLGTLVLLAPAFEEFLFRGFLLPSLAGRMGAAWALVVTSVVFAGIHLQPRGLPTLLCLGLVLGLSVLRLGRLTAAIQVHAIWNGGVFLLMWILAG